MTKFQKWHYIKDQTGIYNIGTKLDSCLAQTCDEETAIELAKGGDKCATQ